MRVDELITATRISGRLSDADTDYTDARIRQELTDAVHTVFGARIIQSQGDYWLKDFDTATTATRTRYRMPYRASSIKSVSFTDDASRAYDLQGDQVVFPTAPGASLTLRFQCYLRPSLLVQEQTTGLISSVNVDTRQVVVNTVPTDRVLAATILTGAKMDIVHPNGWHELAVVGAIGTFATTTITFAIGTDLSDVEVGDYVRAAEQTDWPCIQDDYHRVLVDVTAATILRSRGDMEKANALMAKALGTDDEPGDLRRFEDLIEPRVKNSRPICIPTVGILRGGGRSL